MRRIENNTETSYYTKQWETRKYPTPSYRDSTQRQNDSQIVNRPINLYILFLVLHTLLGSHTIMTISHVYSIINLTTMGRAYEFLLGEGKVAACGLGKYTGVGVHRKLNS